MGPVPGNVMPIAPSSRLPPQTSPGRYGRSAAVPGGSWLVSSGSSGPQRVTQGARKPASGPARAQRFPHGPQPRVARPSASWGWQLRRQVQARSASGASPSPGRSTASCRSTLAIFLARTEEDAGPGLPRFVRRELHRYLDCGILAHGFARVFCSNCGRDELVAFSCKGRGFCPSCCGRRMADTAAHLVDDVLPRVPVRQWVLSLPFYPLNTVPEQFFTDSPRNAMTRAEYRPAHP